MYVLSTPALERTLISCTFPTWSSGLLLWKTAHVVWNYRCLVTFRSEAPDLHAFFYILHSDLAKWLEMLELSLSHEAVCLHMKGIEGQLSEEKKNQKGKLMSYFGIFHHVPTVSVMRLWLLLANGFEHGTCVVLCNVQQALD